LNVEFLETRMLLASPVSLTPLTTNPIINPISGLTSPLLNPVTNLLNPITSLLNPVTNLLNPVTSAVSPLLGSIINPLLGAPLPGSLVNALVGPVISPLPNPLLNPLQAPLLGPVTSLLPATPLPSLPGLISKLFQPTPPPTGSYVPSGASGFGGAQYNPSSPFVAYYSAPNHQPTYSGGLGEVTMPAAPEEISSSSEVGASGGNDAIVTVGLGEDDERTMNGARLQDVMLAFEDDLRIENLAATLLTGARPRASLLPQRGSQVAPVATLLSDDSGETNFGANSSDDDRSSDLQINPAANYPRDSSSLTPPVRDESESDPTWSSSTMSSEQKTGKSFIPGLLVSGLVTAMMTFKVLGIRRADHMRNQYPSLAKQ
jgi:hypothetical protein